MFGRSESLRLTDGQPRDKINASLDWDADPVGLTVRTNRYGRVLSTGSSTDLSIPAGAGVADYWLEPKWITDVEVRFQALPGVQLAVGADNVFDVYPTKAPAGGVSTVAQPLSPRVNAVREASRRLSIRRVLSPPRDESVSHREKVAR